MSAIIDYSKYGLEEYEARAALQRYKIEKEAAKRRGWEQRKRYEASLRRQGYDEEYIRTR